MQERDIKAIFHIAWSILQLVCWAPQFGIAFKLVGCTELSDGICQRHICKSEGCNSWSWVLPLVAFHHKVSLWIFKLWYSCSYRACTCVGRVLCWKAIQLTQLLSLEITSIFHSMRLHQKDHHCTSSKLPVTPTFSCSLPNTGHLCYLDCFFIHI